MKQSARDLARLYTVVFRRYIEDRRETELEQAYELGRKAIAAGLGILDVAQMHNMALAMSSDLVFGIGPGTGRPRVAESFLLEALSPFEATFRGFRETNAKLQERNEQLENQILQRHLAELALQTSESLLHAVLEHSPAAISLKDTRGRYLRINPGFQEWYKMSEREIVGRTDEQIFPKKLAIERQLNDRMVFRTGRPVEFERTETVSRKTRTCLVSKFPLRDAGGRIFALCAIAVDITRRKRAEEALESLSQITLKVQEDERKRISRELHDDVGQLLTAISVSLATLPRMRTSRTGFTRRLAETQRLIRSATDSIHNFARELRPAMLDQLGLVPALRSHINTIQKLAKRNGLEIRLRADYANERLGEEQKAAAFRIVQEALNNVMKHSRATRADVAVFESGNSVCLEVRDNGRAFDVELASAPRPNQRLGLVGMRERARLIDAHFNINSSAGQGTTIQLKIPTRNGHSRGLASANGSSHWNAANSRRKKLK